MRRHLLRRYLLGKYLQEDQPHDGRTDEKPERGAHDHF
jgi:hypothetical protein